MTYGRSTFPPVNWDVHCLIDIEWNTREGVSCIDDTRASKVVTCYAFGNGPTCVEVEDCWLDWQPSLPQRTLDALVSLQSDLVAVAELMW